MDIEISSGDRSRSRMDLRQARVIPRKHEEHAIATEGSLESWTSATLGEVRGLRREMSGA